MQDGLNGAESSQGRHNSPKITADYAEDGPKMVWESIEIPSDEGGHSSVIVAEGKVYLSLIWHRDVQLSEHRTRAPKTWLSKH